MLGWRSMRFRRRASFLWRSVHGSARLRSRQRGGGTRPSSRVWPISDFGAVRWCGKSGELRADGEPVRVGGQRAPAGLSGARPEAGTNKASAKARGVGPLPPRRKVPIAGPKGHVCPPDRNTTPFELQTARARTQETPAWPKHSKRTVNELKKRPCLCIRGRKKRVFGQSLTICAQDLHDHKRWLVDVRFTYPCDSPRVLSVASCACTARPAASMAIRDMLRGVMAETKQAVDYQLAPACGTGRTRYGGAYSSEATASAIDRASACRRATRPATRPALRSLSQIYRRISRTVRAISVHLMVA